jgi:hypothetical protein
MALFHLGPEQMWPTVTTPKQCEQAILQIYQDTIQKTGRQDPCGRYMMNGDQYTPEIVVDASMF